MTGDVTQLSETRVFGGRLLRLRHEFGDAGLRHGLRPVLAAAG